jgi:hypothetical protein
MWLAQNASSPINKLARYMRAPRYETLRRTYPTHLCLFPRKDVAAHSLFFHGFKCTSGLLRLQTYERTPLPNNGFGQSYVCLDRLDARDVIDRRRRGQWAHIVPRRSNPSPYISIIYAGRWASYATSKGMLVHARPIVSMVDDNEAVRIATAILIRSLGRQAQLFASAEEFLNYGQIKETACLVSDVQMPNMSGIEMHVRLLELG